MISLQLLTGTVWESVWLGKDATITIENVNPLFDTEAGGSFSQSFTIDVRRNMHLFGTASEIHGTDVYTALYGRKFRLSFMGVPMLYGVIHLDDEVIVEDGMVDIELASGRKEWDDLLSDKGLQDLPVLDKRIPIGLCTPDDADGMIRVRQKFFVEPKVEVKGKNVTMTAEATYYRNGADQSNGIENYSFDGITPPRALYNTFNEQGVSVDYTNVQDEYDPGTRSHPFCNIRTCFQKYKWDKDSSSWVAKRGYTVHEPTDMNSAPCFYLLWVLDFMFEVLGIQKVNSALDRISDMRRLAFIHTNVGYAYRDEDDNLIDEPVVQQKGVHKFTSSQLTMELTYKSGRQYNTSFMDMHGNGVYCWDSGYAEGHDTGKKTLSITTLPDMPKHPDYMWFSDMSLYRAYATSDNLPDIGFDEFTSAIENAFGARFMYDAESGTCDIILLRDILRQSSFIDLPCDIHSVQKTESDVRGFRLRYSSSTAISKNAITGRKLYTSGSDDTTYNYYDYRRVVLFGSQRTDAGAPSNYKSMLKEVNDSNMNLYIDTDTGNAYRVKVDEDADNTSEWYPSLFEVGGFRDVEIGDCTDDDYVETVEIGFSPMVCNDVNGKAMYKEGTSSTVYSDSCSIPAGSVTDVRPKYAFFMDEEIHVDEDDDGTRKLIERTYDYNAMSLGTMTNTDSETQTRAHVDCQMVVNSLFDYDAATGEPFFDGDASFILGIMRGSGSDAYVAEYDTNYDGEGNSKWTWVAGTDSEMTSDSVDTCGGFYDYDGSGQDSDPHELLSLKLKAEKPIDGGSDDFHSSAYYPIGTAYQKRGLFDRFYADYAYFILHRRVAKLAVTMPLAMLTSIDMTRRYRLGSLNGFIKQYSYTLTQDSITDQTIEVYYL